ncbi:mitochondrial import receptor subunit TOM40B isoform X4 [Passer montanus]|uniref:mitochondrial import receptor subunit TOM40B isoform X4 n=1 Tax=Passer montanus TaxID=9160 RepID=UPI001961B36B|nr:mitochondrial import receptor subunit TOM40B isoform X4 [Passer montanus]
MGNAEGRAPRRAEPRGNPGSFDELHRLCKEVFPPQMEGVKLIVTKTLSSHFQVTHTVHMSTLGPSGYRFNATFLGDRQLGAELSPGVPAVPVPHVLSPGVPHAARGHGQQWQPQRAGRAAAGRAPARQGRVPDAPGQVRDVAVRRRVPRRGLHGHAHAGQPRPAGRLRDRGGTLPAERHRPPGAGRGARVPPAARRGGSHPHPGREVLGPALGDNAQRGLRRRPRQLLPPGQRAGLLDSNWSVGGVLEKKLPPLPVTLALGAFLNHWRSRFHCGFSVTVG